uniref:CHCH domain-containing protein n=1 Tax=Corethron hystrix TaxID=216773 RepID=A0A7S1BES1_9STRA|mmetsp:Transcript_23753/g.54139  ORF Transcript_23753/g.54139 Transcript_23753/m.54139 type:complete len:146 (+) Transcript_23753:25-462(+)
MITDSSTNIDDIYRPRIVRFDSYLEAIPNKRVAKIQEIPVITDVNPEVRNDIFRPRVVRFDSYLETVPKNRVIKGPSNVTKPHKNISNSNLTKGSSIPVGTRTSSFAECNRASDIYSKCVNSEIENNIYCQNLTNILRDCRKNRK